jgi:hypothetical protein
MLLARRHPTAGCAARRRRAAHLGPSGMPRPYREMQWSLNEGSYGINDSEDLPADVE